MSYFLVEGVCKFRLIIWEWIGRHGKNTALSGLIGMPQGTQQHLNASSGNSRNTWLHLGYLPAPFMAESQPNKQTWTLTAFCERIKAYCDCICGDINRYTLFRLMWGGFVHLPAVFNVKRWPVQCGAHARSHTHVTDQHGINRDV